MRPLKCVPILAVVCVVSLFDPSRTFAEDTKGKWQFGFGLSYYSTQDYIRSNADLAIATSVVGENTNGLPSVGSVDERPDINILNQASVHDDFKIDFNASYGLTRWLALEAAVSYLNAPVGNIEFYNRNQHQGITAPTDSLLKLCGPDAVNGADCWQWTAQSTDEIKTNTFLPVGTLTEVPIHLSGLIRFRPESPFDPYIGAGFGYILTDLKKGDEFNRTAEFFGSPDFKVTVADEGEYTLSTRCRRENGSACTEFHPGPLEANIKDSWEWHAVGGVDYYMNDRFSLYVDARYVWTSGAVDIRTDGAHQVRFGVIDPGTLIRTERHYNLLDPNDPLGPGIPSSGPYLWEDIGVPANRAFHELCPECQGDGYLETEDKNTSGALDELCADPGNPGPNSCEDIGFLYQLAPGSRDVDEAMRIACPACAGNHVLDTEDANGNGYLDRFLIYGVDVCTTPQGAGNPNCDQNTIPRDMSRANYVWPEGCPQRPDQLAPFAQLTESGCPPFPPVDPLTGNRPALTTTGTDNAADTFIVQGGRIRLGGFALGVGFKFTF